MPTFSRRALSSLIIVLFTSHISGDEIAPNSTTPHPLPLNPELLPESSPTPEKRSINSLLDHLSDLQELSKLSSLPGGLGLGGLSSLQSPSPGGSSPSTSHYEEESDYSGPSEESHSSSDDAYDTSSHSKDNSHYDDSGGGQEDEYASSSPGGRAPTSGYSQGYTPSANKHSNPLHSPFRGYNSPSSSSDKGLSHLQRYQEDDDERDSDPGYPQNSYTPTDTGLTSPESEDSLPFFPSHGVPTPERGYQLETSSGGRLQSPAEYRVPMYTSMGRGHRKEPTGTTPSSSYYAKNQETTNFPGFSSNSGARGGGGGHRNNFINSHQGQGGRKQTSPGHDLGLGPVGGSTFPYGLPLPPIPPQFGGPAHSPSADNHKHDNLPRNDKVPRYLSPVLRPYFGSVPSPYAAATSPGRGESYALSGYGHSGDRTNFHSASSSPSSSSPGESYHHETSSTPLSPPRNEQRRPHFHSQKEDDDDDSVGYGGLANPPRDPIQYQNHPQFHPQGPQFNHEGQGHTLSPKGHAQAPSPPPSNVESIANYNYNLNLQGIRDAAEYDSQLSLTNAAAYSAVQHAGLSPPMQLSPGLSPGPSPNFSVFNNYNPGLSSLYDGLAGYGLGSGGNTLNNGLLF